jgi:purine nucleosidase
VGLDVTLKCKLQGSDFERLKSADNPASRFLMQLIGLWMDANPGNYPTLHDPLAVASAIRPAIIETQSGAVEVETSSPLTDGMTIFRAGSNGAGTTRVATDVNPREFLDLFVKRLSTAPRKP